MVQILGTNRVCRNSGLSVSEHRDYLACSEGVFATKNDKQARGAILRLSTWIIRVFGLLGAIVLKTVSRFNRFGSYEIDEKTIEAGHNYHDNSRIHNLTH